MEFRKMVTITLCTKIHIPHKEAKKKETRRILIQCKSIADS